MKNELHKKPVPITEEWLQLKAITKITSLEWEIPVNESADDVIVVKGSRGHFEAFHKIDGNVASKTMYDTDEVEYMYRMLTGKDL